MANITGVVEIIMTNKFNDQNWAMKLEGDDQWYGQTKEWLEIVPKRGDKVSFSGGKTGKYIQYLEILESASPAAAPAAKSGGGGFNALGVELGHAANNAVNMLTAAGEVPNLVEVQDLAIKFYRMMKETRELIENEGKKVVSEEAPKASPKPKAKPKAKPVVEDDPDDDLPF